MEKELRYDGVHNGVHGMSRCAVPGTRVEASARSAGRGVVHDDASLWRVLIHGRCKMPASSDLSSMSFDPLHAQLDADTPRAPLNASPNASPPELYIPNAHRHRCPCSNT